MIVRRGHKYAKFSKKIPTYLPKVKLIGKSKANKYNFMDGLAYDLRVPLVTPCIGPD